MVRKLVALFLRPAPPTRPPSSVLLRSYALPPVSSGHGRIAVNLRLLISCLTLVWPIRVSP